MNRILFFAFLFLFGLSQAQTKSKGNAKTKAKAEKEWVNPVKFKLTKEELKRPYMEDVLKTRDSLTPKEAERRRKNIAIGNPFAKQGFYPKIATLSRGKYLEFHDRDSIVSIGSVKYNRKQKKIIDFIEEDFSNPDRQPLGDTHGRWMSPDPLSEEFSNWSPYNFVYNNPLKFIDPDGRAASPIFDENGTLLGTDDQGVKGDAIVMNKKDFKQGMSHSDALSKGTLATNLADGSAARENAEKFMADAKNRPDYDGALTLNEVNSWARHGSSNAQSQYGNGNLFVDVGKIDTSSFDYKEISSANSKGNYYFNFLSFGSAAWNTTMNYMGSDTNNTGLVYGNLRLEITSESMNRNNATLSIGNRNTRLVDTYDFNTTKGSYYKRTANAIGAHTATIGGKYKIVTYDIYGYGTKTISK